MKRPIIPWFYLLLPAIVLGQQEPGWQGQTVRQWADRLADEDVRVRWHAAYALGQIGPEAARAVEPLKKVLQERPENEYVRGAAAWALGRIAVRRDTIVPLLGETLGSGHLSVRRNSSRALGSLGSAAKPATVGLIGLLDDDDATVRVHAAEALWRIDRHARAIPALVQMTRWPRGPGPYQAVAALGRIGSPTDAAISALVAALRHADADVRRAAVRALGQLGPAAISALEQTLAGPDHEVRRRAVEALGQIGPEALPSLIESLRNESPPARRAAARALGRLGAKAKAAEPALIVAVNDADPHVQEAAARALGRIRKQ